MTESGQRRSIVSDAVSVTDIVLAAKSKTENPRLKAFRRDRRRLLDAHLADICR